MTNVHNVSLARRAACIAAEKEPAMRGTALRIMECCLVAFALTAVLAHTLRMRIKSIDESADGAFRDGMYQATLDVQERRRPHVTSRRWNMEQDPCCSSPDTRSTTGSFSTPSPTTLYQTSRN